MKRIAAIALLIFFPFPVPSAQAKRPMTVEDLFAFKRIAEPQISPDGKQVVYVLRTVNLKENYQYSNLWLAPTGGGEPKQLTNNEKGNKHPKWSPDGKHILFESNRNGGYQLYAHPVAGGRPRQLTDIATEANNAIWSPDGKWIAFTSAVWPEYSDKPFKESNELNKKRKEEKDKNPVKAKVFGKLFYRHWDEYVEDKRQHLFVIEVKETSDGLVGGEPRDVTPGDYDGYPTSSTFSAGDDFTFTPDGKYLLFASPPRKHEAWSTNYDIWRVPVAGGEPENLTKDNPAADGCPVFSPDGKWLAYRAQKRPGFEADKWDIVIVDSDIKSKPRRLTADHDRSAEAFVWGADSKTLFFTTEEQGRSPVVGISVETGKLWHVVPASTNNFLSISKDGQALAFLRFATHHPPEVFVLKGDLSTPPKPMTGISAQNVSQANAKLLEELDLPLPESVTVKGAGGTPMQMWILKPPGFDPKKKWPLAYLVHGGPQGAWEDGWSWRWNPQVWAAQGYVVALPNPRGSTGFGQKYVDEISGDWGGKCYEDLMAGVAWLEQQPYIDKDRMAAAGASFGGYMMNWFQGNTNKFKTLITHCGVYNLESMWASTEELWFDEWEHGQGEPPWIKPEGYRKHSPHLLAKNFQTPMLVIQNDLDYRVPVSEGHMLFTTLQRKGIPSRFVNFPDEGHWVLKPANSAYWHKEVFDWLKKYAPPGGR